MNINTATNMLSLVYFKTTKKLQTTLMLEMQYKTMITSRGLKLDYGYILPTL